VLAGDPVVAFRECGCRPAKAMVSCPQFVKVVPIAALCGRPGQPTGGMTLGLDRDRSICRRQSLTSWHGRTAIH
jgi:hypothetical protein